MRVNALRLTVFALCLLFAQAAAAQEPVAVVDDRWANGITEPWWFNSQRYTPEQAAAARALWERIGDARVTRVGKAYVEVNTENEWYDDLVTPVRISAGSDQGLRRGMTLHALDSDDYDERVELTRVGRDYALGIFVRTVRKHPGVKMGEGDDGRDKPPAPIAVGWRLTTGQHKWLRHRAEVWAAEEAAKEKH